MEDLLAQLCRQSINKAMMQKKVELANIPLADWLDELQEQRVKLDILDVGSVQAYIKVFNATFDIEAIDVKDLRCTSAEIGGILNHILRPPNNLQFGIAQAATSLLTQCQRQVYVLPCGAGKSRVAASIALLLLGLNTKVKAVHLVYVNEVLKRKDKDDFKDLWSMIPNGDRLWYHSDIQFTPGP